MISHLYIFNLNVEYEVINNYYVTHFIIKNFHFVICDHTHVQEDDGAMYLPLFSQS
jgi:hypothetical protein